MSRTRVRVHITTVDYFNPETEGVKQHSLLGKLTVIEAKKLVRTLNSKNIYIDKVTKIDEFEVNTQQLHNLKGK